MKIAVLSAEKSIHTVRWVNSLSQSGHKVTLISLPEHKSTSGGVNSGIEVIYLKHGRSVGYWLGGAQLRHLLKKLKPDVLSAHYATGYGTLARRSNFKPVLLSVWGSDIYEFPLKGRLHKRIVQKNLEYADAVASTSNAMANRARSLFIPKKIYITPFGVESEKFFPAHTVKAGCITVGTVKSLEPKYGTEYLLRAFSLLIKKMTRERSLPADGLRLEIYGGGSQLKNLRDLAVRLGIEGSTHFHGQIVHSEVPGILNGFDIFCAASTEDSESFGVAVVEAMACGIPVVVSDTDGFCEVVADKETGFIVKRRDYVTMSNKLYELALDEKLRDRMGKAGTEHVRAHYEWKDCVAAMEKALSDTESQNKEQRRPS